MSVFPTYSIDTQNVKYRFGERYISEATNKKFLGVPRGVYLGFTPSFDANTLSMAPDSTYGVSLARLTSQDNSLYPVDIITEDTITLDFTGHSTYPINVVLSANGALGQPHSAEIFTQVASPSDPTEILLGVVVNDAIYHGDVSGGPFLTTETITGSLSGATATLDSIEDGFIRVSGVTGTFEAGETITGNTSLASTTISSGIALAIFYDLPTNRSNPFAYTNAPLGSGGPLGGYGFMPEGSVEDLLNAVSMVAEVQDARTDLTGFVHPNLKDRLDTDATGEAIAGRLGKEIRTIVGGDFTLSSSAFERNVSKFFARPHRALLAPAVRAPVENIQGYASESRLGAVTSGTVPEPAPTGALSDSERNVCAIIDTSTERRFQESLTGSVAYGRLSLSEIPLTGTLTFTATDQIVTGSGSLFSSQIQIQDIIQDTVGDFYEVDAVPTTVSGELLATIGGVAAPHDFSTSPLSNLTSVSPGTVTISVDEDVAGPSTITDDGVGNLVGPALVGPGTINYSTGTMTGITVNLAAASQVTATYSTVSDEVHISIPAQNSGSSNGLLRRRFTLTFYRRTGSSTETTVVVPSGTSIRFFVPLWYSIEASLFDQLVILYKNYDTDPVATATTTTSGKALMASGISGAEAGALFAVQDGGIPVGSGNFHTMNFVDVTVGGSGVADVTQRGATGPTGPPGGAGSPGPAGPTGPRGIGYANNEYIDIGGPFRSTPIGGTIAPGASYTHDTDFASTAGISNLLFMCGGIAGWYPLDFNNDETFIITNISKVSDTYGRITGQMPLPIPQNSVWLFLNGAGE